MRVLTPPCKAPIKKLWQHSSRCPLTQTDLCPAPLPPGYGHTVPLSDEGKAFCIFYAFCGVPVTLFMLSLLVKRIMSVVTQRPVAYFHRRWGVSASRLAAVHATVLAVLMVVILLFIPAGIFTSLEKDWDYLESLYFCFISLSTIGLGDYVPGETHSNDDITHPQLYRLAITSKSSCSQRCCCNRLILMWICLTPLSSNSKNSLSVILCASAVTQ